MNLSYPFTLSLIFLTAACATTNPRPAVASCAHSHKSFKCVEYLKNYDGDTATFNVPDIHPIIGANIRVRILGIDAPEMTSKHRCTKRRALDAKLFVKRILSSAKRIDLVNIKRDKYFRLLADVLVDEQSLGPMILATGLAKNYISGAKPKWPCPANEKGPK